jgi:hypothetical protein
MRNRLISLACWLSALVITIGLSLLAAHWKCFPSFVLASSIWAVLDSKRVRLRRYYTAIAGGPATVFILLMVLGWPVVFPWYLGMRLKIMTGTARLRDEYQASQMSNATMESNGLIQPWRGLKL